MKIAGPVDSRLGTCPMRSRSAPKTLRRVRLRHSQIGAVTIPKPIHAMSYTPNMGRCCIACEESTQSGCHALLTAMRLPLYVQIVIALALGALAGLVLPYKIAADLDVPAKMILRFLGAIAPPLILLAVMRALIG